MSRKAFLKKRPGICLSLNCLTMVEVESEISQYGRESQYIEWCVDKMQNAEDYTQEAFLMDLKKVRALTRGKKLIVDYKGDETLENQFIRWSMGVADIVDIDWDNTQLHRLVKEARKKGCKTLISHHEFEKMPDKDMIATMFIRMEKTDGDILKIACMAKEESDTYAILEGASAYCQLRAHKPIVAIAMGEEGQVSRICAGDFGSVISYACGSKQTAPGQINVRKLAAYMDRYYKKEDC